MSIGENIRKMREKKEMTQCDLGERMGLDRSEIVRYESGQKNITLAAAVFMAQILECDVHDFINPTAGGR